MMKKCVLSTALLAALTACQSQPPNTQTAIQNIKSAPMTDPAKIRAGELLNQAVALYDKQDYQNALTAFLEADTAGHFKAKRYLGLMYLKGEGVAKNEPQAFDYFKQASENGDITSQYWLGYCYENGIGTNADLKQAVYWYQKSAERGDHVSEPAINALKRLNIRSE